MRRRSRPLIEKHVQPRPARDQNIPGSPPSYTRIENFAQGGEPGSRLHAVWDTYMSLTLGNFDFHFYCGDMANFVLYREALHLQCLLREWAWSM